VCLGLACCENSRALQRLTMTQLEAHWDSAQEGAELIREGEPEQAVALLTELIQREPDNEYAYFFLGAAYFELEGYDRALKAYVKTLELKPDYVGAMIGTGHTLRMLGRYVEAIRMAHQVLARAKDDPDALFLIGTSSFARGEEAQAKIYLTRYLETNPELEVATEVHGILKLIEEHEGTEQDQEDA